MGKVGGRKCVTMMSLGNPLLRKGGSQTIRQTCLYLLRIPQATPAIPIVACSTQAACGIRKGSTLFQKGGPNIVR